MSFFVSQVNFCCYNCEEIAHKSVTCVVEVKFLNCNHFGHKASNCNQEHKKLERKRESIWFNNLAETYKKIISTKEGLRALIHIRNRSSIISELRD